MVFAQPGITSKMIGSLVFWASSVLDGTDGELSRLKFMETRLGGWLDLWSDNVVHIMVFIGMGFGLSRDLQDPLWLALGATAAAGVFLSVTKVSWSVAQKKNKGGPLYTGVEEIAPDEKSWVRRLTQMADALSRRDFIFGVMFITLFGWLPYFLWAAAIGSNVYWFLLLIIALGKRAK